MNGDYSETEELYDVMKQLLPQIESELKQEMQAKYSKMFSDKEQSLHKQFEQLYRRRIQEYTDRQAKTHREYEKTLEDKMRQVQRRGEEILNKGATQMKSRIEQLQRQVQVLQHQKQNWTRLQRGYQNALTDLNLTQKNCNSASVQEGRVNSTQTNSKVTQKNFETHSVVSQSSQIKKTTLTIETQNLKQTAGGKQTFSINSSLYRTDQTQENCFQIQGVLSPPCTDPGLIGCMLQTKVNKPQGGKKPLFWNQDKKQQLLQMIRTRMN